MPQGLEQIAAGEDRGPRQRDGPVATHGSAALLTSFHANSDCAVNTMTARTDTNVAIDREVVGVDSSRKTVVSSVLQARSTASSGSLEVALLDLERERWSPNDPVEPDAKRALVARAFFIAQGCAATGVTYSWSALTIPAPRHL